MLLSLPAGIVLTSGYTPVLTNRDGFCVVCHVMRPFRSSWAASVHGGNNRTGVVVQCVACHLPHDSLARFVRHKVRLGLGGLIAMASIDPKMHDWAGNARRNRTRFTYDSGCLRCHGAFLSVASAAVGGDRASRCDRRLLAEPGECVVCHPHVGHRDAMLVAEKYFHDVADSDVPESVAPGQRRHGNGNRQ